MTTSDPDDSPSPPTPLSLQGRGGDGAVASVSPRPRTGRGARGESSSPRTGRGDAPHEAGGEGVSYLQHDVERPAPDPAAVRDALLAWFAAYGRDLPWRRTRDPYAVLVAEMMLQQTGVERVLPKYAAWLERFPTLEALAAAPRGEVIRLWAGLGYNSRAVRLHEMARQAVERFGGRLPATMQELQSLKGIGHYTAGAVLCFAHERDVAFVDTNIRRVLSRLFHGPEDVTVPLTERETRELAERVLPRGDSWAWHQALMDLGATICTDARPACLVCPLRQLCRAAFRAGRVAREARAGYCPSRKEGPWQGSTRYYRGRIVAALGALAPGERIGLAELAARITPASPASTPTAGPANVPPTAAADPIRDTAWLRDLLARLAADGLATLHQDRDGQTSVSLPE